MKRESITIADWQMHLDSFLSCLVLLFLTLLSKFVVILLLQDFKVTIDFFLSIIFFQFTSYFILFCQKLSIFDKKTWYKTIKIFYKPTHFLWVRHTKVWLLHYFGNRRITRNPFLYKRTLQTLFTSPTWIALLTWQDFKNSFLPILYSYKKKNIPLKVL